MYPRARLSIHDAKGHLEHFCACLPTVPYVDPPRPEYIFESLPAEEFRADVVLPHRINIVPHRIRGRYAWKSQKMATKDAALQAYVRLYEVGLINKNLLPKALPDPVVLGIEGETEEVQSLLCVQGRVNPWAEACGSRDGACRQILTIRARVSGWDPLPDLHLPFPAVFQTSMAFKMFWTKEQDIDIEISPVCSGNSLLDDDEFRSLAHLSTQRLLESVFPGKMQIRNKIPHMSPFLVVPSLETAMLQKWLTKCTSDMFAEHFDDLRPEWGLIRIKAQPKAARPYVFRSSGMRTREHAWIREPSSSPHPAFEEVHFEAKVLPKRLDYLHPPSSTDFNTAVAFIPAAECYVDPFPTSYAKVMLFLPSILHKLELRGVAMALTRNLLPSIDFESLELVEKAICSSAANESSNYQRLELIGDSILKFWTSAQLCAQFPGWHEGYLTRGKDRVVSNSHLCKAALDNGLDEYVHTVPFSGSRWRPPTVEPQPRREISSKVLADVVEALIGASFLDGKDEQDRALKVEACLTTLLTSVPWRSPAENASRLKDLVPKGSGGFENFKSLSEITGFSFDRIILLIEALTHPSHPPVGIQGSYQRLEFLGDSILDFLVVETMTRHSREISHFTMHLIRTAVVNAHLLAFFSLGTNIEHDCAEVRVDESGGGAEIGTIRRKTYLWEFMKHSGKLELLQAQKKSAQRYSELKLAIETALNHGKSHPWYLLLSLNAEKFFSDIIESILGAIFIDSNGSLKACEEFLIRLGLLTYLRRLLTEDVDVMHPKERLGVVARHSITKYVATEEIVDDAVQYSCKVSVDDQTAATSTGEVSKAAAEVKAAQHAVELILTKRGQSVERRKRKEET